MNLRQYSIALLISALPITALAHSQGISLGPGDFVMTDKLLKNGESINEDFKPSDFKLSKSGRSKIKKLQTQLPSNAVGVDGDFIAKHSGIENGR